MYSRREEYYYIGGGEGGLVPTWRFDWKGMQAREEEKKALLFSPSPSLPVFLSQAL